MGRMVNRGFDDVTKLLPPQVKRETIRNMLEASAKVYVDEWKNSIKTHNHVRPKSGAMLNSVAATPVVESPDGGRCEVYPQGVDNHRVRNATKAYVLNYGRGSEGRPQYIKGDHFVTQAENAARQRAADAMQEVLNNSNK